MYADGDDDGYLEVLWGEERKCLFVHCDRGSVGFLAKLYIFSLAVGLRGPRIERYDIQAGGALLRISGGGFACDLGPAPLSEEAPKGCSPFGGHPPLRLLTAACVLPSARFSGCRRWLASLRTPRPLHGFFRTSVCQSAIPARGRKSKPAIAGVALSQQGML